MNELVLIKMQEKLEEEGSLERLSEIQNLMNAIPDSILIRVFEESSIEPDAPDKFIEIFKRFSERR